MLTFGVRMEESAMDRKLVPHHSHWGAFSAVVEDGKVIGAVPFDFDPDPSPLIESIPDAVHSPLRIGRPMVRAADTTRALARQMHRFPFPGSRCNGRCWSASWRHESWSI